MFVISALVVVAVGLFAPSLLFASYGTANWVGRAALGFIVAAPVWILLLIGVMASR